MTAQFKLRWPVERRIITQYFGENPHIYAKFNQAGHEGIDFSAAVGTNILACADGKVLDVRPDDGNAYGLYVRLQHQHNGHTYQTIYAHLSKPLVSKGQTVQAGQVIALSGNTGHSFGPHLHLTLKLIGAKTPGYPDGVIDPLPYLQEQISPQPSDLTIYTTDQVRLRSGPTTASAHLAWMGKGERLTVLGSADQARAKIGRQEEWIQVRRADGMDGFVAAWYVQLGPTAPAPPEPQPEPPESLVVYATEPLNVRNGPSIGTSRIAIALPQDPLPVIGDASRMQMKIGDRGEWLPVRLPNGIKGYIAAWYVRTEPGAAPDVLLTISPTEDMNMRERPTTSARIVGRLALNTPLTVHDDPERARALVGRYGEWLYVDTPEGQQGWVAAWYVQIQPPSFALPTAPRAEAVEPLTVYTIESLPVHNGPSLDTSRVAVALPNEPLIATSDRWIAESRLGQRGEWLQVRLPDGKEGYVPAGYVGSEPDPAPIPLLTVYPMRAMSLYERPTAGARSLRQLEHNTPLQVHDNPELAQVAVGRFGEWLYVETEDDQRGWVTAWFISTEPT